MIWQRVVSILEVYCTLELAIEACAQYANDKDAARFGYAATYTPSTGTLPADTNIKNEISNNLFFKILITFFTLISSIIKPTPFCLYNLSH